MFCSQCGKRVMENMLFCPFCGSPIVIPDEESEETAPPKPSAAPTEATAQPPQEVSEEAARRAAEDFVPLKLDMDWEHEEIEIQDVPEPEPPKAEPEQRTERKPSEEVSALLSSQLEEEPVRLQGHAPELKRARNPERGKRPPRRNTYAPVKAFNPNDIFLDGADADDDSDDDEDAFAFEEPEEGGFLVRHIRGIVALSMIAIVLAVFAGWAFSDQGQAALAGSGLAWRSSAYEKLGFEAYQNQNYALAGQYYAQALARDADNASHANSAGVAYYMANDVGRATEMARRVIELNPASTDGYQLLLRLYPDAAKRPWEITTLLQKGYQLTGDASFNVE